MTFDPHNLIHFFYCITLASAFAPARNARPSTAMKMAFDVESQPGVIAPTGFWDPFNLAKDIDEETFTKYRTAELKHGRVCQLAVVGFLAAEAFRFPGSIGGVDFADIPNGVAALNVLPAFGWAQIAMSIGYWETFGWKQTEGSTPGDFGFKGNQPEPDNLMKTRELQHCRLAMIGAFELVCHSLAKPEASVFDLNFY